MLVFILLFSGIVFGLGFLITEKNAKYLLSGYNTMSKTEQEQVNLKGYIPFMKQFHISLGSFLLIGGLLLYFFNYPEAAMMFVVICALLGWTYFLYKGMSFFPKWYRSSSYFGIVILILTTLLVAHLMTSSTQPNQLLIEDGQLKIEGMYSHTINMNSIKELSVVSAVPPIAMRTNGVSMGDIQKGHYRTKSGEAIRVYKEDGTHPFLQIQVNGDKTIYYQLRNASDQAVLEQLKIDHIIE